MGNFVYVCSLFSNTQFISKQKLFQDCPGPSNELVPQIEQYPNICQYPLINYLGLHHCCDVHLEANDVLQEKVKTFRKLSKCAISSVLVCWVWLLEWHISRSQGTGWWPYFSKFSASILELFHYLNFSSSKNLNQRTTLTTDLNIFCTSCIDYYETSEQKGYSTTKL